MREVVEIAWGQIQSAWRFWRVALLAAWGICLLGWLAAFSVPGRYESHAKIFVDTNALLEPLLKGLAVETDVSSQTELVRRMLVSRTQIERVVDSSGLAKRAKNTVEREALIKRTSERIELSSDPKSKFFTISYRDIDPDVSVSVVKSLLDSFINQSVGGSRGDAESAQKFLMDQISDYEARLTAAEQRLADFKKQNVGLMPDQRGGYYERLQAEMLAKEQNERDLHIISNKREELRRQLSSDSGGGELATVAIDTRILEAQTKLQEMLTRFTEAHPDVIALQEQIDTLNAQKKAIQDHSAGSGGGSGTNLVSQNLQIAYNQSAVEEASLRTQLADRNTRIAELRRMVNVLPEVEAEYSRLNRDYGITKAQYEALVQRLETAKISDDAGRNTESRLRVVEPPVRPLSTVSPNRPLMLTTVFFLGLSGAMALAWLLSQIRPVIASLAAIQKITDAPVLGTIGSIVSPQQLASARRARLAVIVGVSALTVGFVLTLGFSRQGEQVGRVVSNAMGLT